MALGVGALGWGRRSFRGWRHHSDSCPGSFVKRGHLDRFRPICPICRAAGRPPPALALRVHRDRGDEVDEGALICPERMCQAEYPILDGIPFVVPNPREVIAGQIEDLRAASGAATGEGSAWADSVRLDSVGPGSPLERHHHHLSSYGRGHWGDLDPVEPRARDGGVAAVLATALELLPAPPTGAWLDVGCSVGRASFELAARTDDLVLGVDLNVSMLRLARRVAREGRGAHPLRRVGVVYDRRDFAVEPAGRDRVDFWVCDAIALPFADRAVDGVTSLNVLDCVQWPLSHLIELGRVLRSGGSAVLATPYDWSPAATPFEGWLGGHSQRAEHHGSSAREVRRLLAVGDPAEAGTRLELVAEREAVPWRVYVHERAEMQYQVHLVVARAV